MVGPVNISAHDDPFLKALSKLIVLVIVPSHHMSSDLRWICGNTAVRQILYGWPRLSFLLFYVS